MFFKILDTFMQLYKLAEAVSLSLKTHSFPEIMHRLVRIFMKNHINKFFRTKMRLKEGTKIELQRDISQILQEGRQLKMRR